MTDQPIALLLSAGCYLHLAVTYIYWDLLGQIVNINTGQIVNMGLMLLNVEYNAGHEVDIGLT